MRQIARCLGLLFVGLLIALCVAISCSLRDFEIDYIYLQPFHDPMRDRDHIDADFLERHGSDARQVIAVHRQSAFGVEIISYEGLSPADVARAATMDSQGPGSDDWLETFAPLFAWTVRAGWPMYALRGEYGELSWQTSAKGPAQRRPTVTWTTRLGSLDFPRQPILSGLAVNTLFYAALVATLVRGPLLVRSLLRRLRGVCPRCGYARHADAHCPECGPLTRA